MVGQSSELTLRVGPCCCANASRGRKMSQIANEEGARNTAFLSSNVHPHRSHSQQLARDVTLGNKDWRRLRQVSSVRMEISSQTASKPDHERHRESEPKGP